MARQKSGRGGWLVAGLALGSIMVSQAAVAVIIGPVHVTDGTFTSQNEWNTGRSTVNKQVFAKGSDGSGGAALYAEQSGGKLFLMYDYFNPQAGLTGNPTTFFDVFFQVPSDNEDYLVVIPAFGSLSVFTKPTGTPSLTNPDGSLNTGAPWVSATAADLTLGGFKGAFSVGISPDSATPHPMAEFELTVDQTAFAQPPPGAKGGLYDPAPAFWGASVGAAGGLDPPISSGIFVLDPTGGTTVTPVLNPVTGGPIAQGNVLPEPASLLLMGVGLAGLAAARRRAA